MQQLDAVDALQQHAAAMRATLGDLEARATKSTAKINEWTAMQQQIHDVLASAPDSVTLNVGGTLFQTTKQTLLRVEGSYFHALLGSDVGDTSGGPYFLDVDPDCFRDVLKVLRTGKMALLNDLTKVEREEVNMTMETLKLAPTTLPRPSHRWGDRGTALKVTADSKTVESNAPMNSLNGAMARQPLVGEIQFQVKSIGDEEDEPFWLGLSPLREGDLTEVSYGNCICYWSDGDLYNSGHHEASLLPIKDGDVLTIRRGRSHVEFQLTPGPPYNIDLDDATEELYPFFSTDKGGVRVTIRN